MENDSTDLTALAWVLEQSCRTATEKCVLIALASLWGQLGRPFHAHQDTIAAFACCSVATIERALRHLVDDGLVVVSRQWDASGKRLPNTYQLMPPSDVSRCLATLREAVPSTLRWAVFERDDFRCQECGSRRRLQADHKVPRSKGGPTTLDNLQTLCISCNSRKRDRMPEVAS